MQRAFDRFPLGGPIGQRRSHFVKPCRRLPGHQGDGISVEQAAIWRESGAELEREVEPLAEEQHRVGALQDLGQPP
jgi:hypothetical protein